MSADLTENSEEERLAEMQNCNLVRSLRHQNANLSQIAEFEEWDLLNQFWRGELVDH